ncbi:MAG: hypothetical protein ACE5KV_06085, partial [Thermoplasmata archaeon]
MSYKEIMDIDTTNELKNRTWWWWWWILFFRNPQNQKRTKQMVILWGTRNCREVLVNDHLWVRKFDLKREKNKVTSYGLTASWYFDGKKMFEPLFLDEGTLISRWAEENGELSLSGEGKYLFCGEPGSNRVVVARPDVSIELDLKPWNEFLSRIVKTGKQYFSHLGYSMHKIRGSKATGRISMQGREEEVEGTGYFQKVRINSPTS